MFSPNNNAIAYFRVSAKLSCAWGDDLNNEHNSDHCWQFAGEPRLAAARNVIFPTATPSDAPGVVFEQEVIRPTAFPSDAPDLFYEEDVEEISTVATSAVSASSPMLASESAISLEVKEHLFPRTEMSSVDKTAYADHCPTVSNQGKATKGQDFITLAYVTDVATQRLAGYHQPIKAGREDSHVVGEQDSFSNKKKREMMIAFTQFCSVKNDQNSFHSPAQSKRRRLMKMLW
jgi:hypothetical protein